MDLNLSFVLPEPGAVVSGGHLYNRGLTQALIGLGASVEVIDLETLITRLAGEHDTDAPERRRYYFDSLYLGSVAALPMERLDAHLIVHHLESLYPDPGVDSDTVFQSREREALHRFRGFLVTSEFTERYLIGRGYRAASVVVATPAAEGFASDRSVVPHDGPLRALVVANLVARKQVLPLLQALARRIAPDALRLRVVGGDGMEPAYAADVHALLRAEVELATWVTLVGTLPHAAMPAEFAAADVLVSAAAMETFGMALQEAVAAGVPVLAIEGGHVAAHIDAAGQGWLMPGCQALADKLAELAADPADLRRRVRARGAGAPLGASDWRRVARGFLESLPGTSARD